MRPHTAQGQGFDRMGVPATHASDLLARPATTAPPGWLLRASVAEPIVGADIREQSVYAHWVCVRFSLAAQLDRQGSEVHARSTAGAALQLRGAAGTWGLSGVLQQWSFVGGLTRQRWQARLAWGRALGRSATLALQLRPPFASDDRAVVELLMSSSHLSPFHLVFREQRVAGFPVMRQFGVVWGNENISLRAGYNGATMATSIGVILCIGPWSWDASASAHPSLGYGRQWGLALSH